MTSETLRGFVRFCGIGLAACAVLVATASRADGVTMLAQYTGAKNDTIKVALYTEGAEVVGLVNMVTPANQRISIAFKKKELAKFIGLVQQAAQINSDQWQAAGSYTETQTKSPSHIMVYGGPGLQMSLTDPSIGVWSFTLQAADVAGFLAVLNQMEDKVVE